MPMPKVMIVDDSDTLRSSLKKLLIASGFDVVEASDGIQGVELWNVNHADVALVITDYNMPEMDGISMVRKIRGMPKGAEVPIFMLTTESSPELKASGKEVGIKAWVTKPFNDEKLMMAVKKMAIG
jgi:two-component system chemotaxis response regulator CheY